MTMLISKGYRFDKRDLTLFVQFCGVVDIAQEVKGLGIVEISSPTGSGVRI